MKFQISPTLVDLFQSCTAATLLGSTPIPSFHTTCFEKKFYGAKTSISWTLHKVASHVVIIEQLSNVPYAYDILWIN